MASTTRYAIPLVLGGLLSPLSSHAEGDTPEAPPAVTVQAGADGFTLTSADKAFQLKLRGYLQTDGRFFASKADKPGSTTFLIRRARPIVEGTLFGAFDFRLMPDFGAGTVQLFDAYLDFHPAKEARLRAGKFKPPIGLERLQSATNTVFIERALPTDLVPNRDVGLQVHGELHGGVLAYALGAFNGTPDGASVDANLDDSFDVAARVFAQPFRAGGPSVLKGLGVGFAASQGQQFGATASTGVAPLRTPGQQTFFSYRTGALADDTVIAHGDHFRLSPQGYFYAGPVGLLAEYVSSTQAVSRGPARARLRNQAWQVTASAVFLGGAPSFEGVRPTHPLHPSEGAWGAVELAGRYHTLNVDADAFPLYADPNKAARAARSWGLAANWYLNANARLAADFDRTTFDGGAPDADRTPESVFLSRFQLSW
ncbi:porin [Myxococcaceae bacterium JPH2]|nr:porin [Myxococcaceae bacterium JPH2]